jgi:hypothetical protein
MPSNPALLTLHGWRFSIYSRIARLVLAEKGPTARFVDIDLFAEPAPVALRAINPFGLVPVLDHAGFLIFETSAITRNLDEADVQVIKRRICRHPWKVTSMPFGPLLDCQLNEQVEPYLTASSQDKPIENHWFVWGWATGLLAPKAGRHLP